MSEFTPSVSYPLPAPSNKSIEGSNGSRPLGKSSIWLEAHAITILIESNLYRCFMADAVPEADGWNADGHRERPH